MTLLPTKHTLVLRVLQSIVREGLCTGPLIIEGDSLVIWLHIHIAYCWDTENFRDKDKKPGSLMFGREEGQQEWEGHKRE